ncbi:MAG: succinate dehydrogenase cytochrome b subunit [Bacteroidota bacterium]|nr:succinate dehydrogenase cytochrome b subunit [Bacteroidota bacterium]
MWLIDSSIGRKLIMSISGVFLVLFLLFHSCMNIVVIISPTGYNAICGFLGANWYALVGTAVLAGGFVIHILYALLLTYQNMRARGHESYAVTKNQKSVEWSSQNMFVLGLIIFGFLALHLYNFWYKMQYVEITGIQTGMFDAGNGAAYVKELFSNWIYCALYIVWLSALWFHLTHGVWSALQSIGLNNTTWLPRLKTIANIISTIVVLMFMSIPVYYLVGCGSC